MRAFEPQRATLGKCRRRAGLALIAGAVLLAACSDKEAELTGYQLEPMADVGDIRMPDVANGDTQQALRARPDGLLIVFLGFTNCPDVCPATMTNI